jgi:parallel beta-helix repeat protein
VHDNHANGLHFNGDESLGGDGLIQNALVEGNVIYGNGAGGGSGINMDGGTGGTIRNNLLYDNHASGISLYRIDASAGASDNPRRQQHDHVNAADGRCVREHQDGSTGNVVRNNILYTSIRSAARSRSTGGAFPASSPTTTASSTAPGDDGGVTR